MDSLIELAIQVVFIIVGYVATMTLLSAVAG